MIRALMIVLSLAASPSFGDVPARAKAAFLGWASANQVSDAVMVLHRRGQTVGATVLGREIDTPIELASLSKAVTAVCVATLVEAGEWTLETTAKDVLGMGSKEHSIARLLTHQAGMGPDQTQILMSLWLGGRQNTAALAAKAALSRPQQTAEVGKYFYNNENYAILGEMIATHTGEDYVDYCRDNALRPAGVTSASPSLASGAFLPYGGWQMSAHDYALFHWHAFGPDGIVGSRLAHWPQATIHENVGYGMGTVQRPFGMRYNFWHFGALCFPGRLNLGTYAVMWSDEWSVVAAYDICATDEQMVALDRAMRGAVFE
jgi:CubicO group peptidase (beta-lactamase class C family)